MRLLSRAQFARRRGISRARVTQLVQSGVITLVDGKIDPEEADKQIDGSINARSDSKKKSRSSSSNNGQTLTDVRRDHELLKKQLTELRLAVETGELVSKTFAIDFLTLQISTARSHFWGLPKGMADILFLKLTETLRVAVSGMSSDVQKFLEPVMAGLKFDGKDVEFLLRGEIRRILKILGEEQDGEDNQKTGVGENPEGNYTCLASTGNQEAQI
ncbi:MAG: hypothetical protein FJ115_10340 [Deltaproteobacteria bacterium]|nr:hypothetical protein [Deltaproteobacteria bacterium]